VIPFTPLANLTVDISWDPVQANPQQGYPNARPAELMFLSISRCAGDLRPPQASSGDPFLQNGCRRLGSGGSLFYTTRVDVVSNEFFCRLEPGVVHYLLVSPVDPTDGVTLGEHTCGAISVFGCDVQARHSGTFQ
jgi:hypothetical protein